MIRRSPTCLISYLFRGEFAGPSDTEAPANPRKVMIDSDLAELYDVETRRLNEQAKSNIDQFPTDFMFQLSNEEFENLKSQFATSSSQRNPEKA